MSLNIYFIFLLSLPFWIHFNKNISVRFLIISTAIYFLIGFIPISNSYRFASNELQLFYLLCLFCLYLGLSLSKSKSKSKNINRQSYFISKKFKAVYALHLTVVYISIFLLFLSMGNFFLNQELRLKIPFYVGYLIRSTAYLPILIAPFLKIRKLKLPELIYYFILPTLPVVLLGARGTFITVILALLICLIIIKKSESNSRILEIYTNNKKIFLIFFSFISIFVIYFLFALRRNGNNLMSISDTINVYFSNPTIFLILILPLYLGFKETIGITEKIFSGNYSNEFLDYPLIIAELVTILPGEQIAPGRIVSGLIFGSGNMIDKGYTPGLTGGLFLDFGYYGTLFCFFLFGIFIANYVKKRSSLKYIIMSTYLVVSFLHLFHRGFLKPEYFTFFIILLLYSKLITKSKTES